MRRTGPGDHIFRIKHSNSYPAPLERLTRQSLHTCTVQYSILSLFSYFPSFAATLRCSCDNGDEVRYPFKHVLLQKFHPRVKNPISSVAFAARQVCVSLSCRTRSLLPCLRDMQMHIITKTKMKPHPSRKNTTNDFCSPQPLVRQELLCHVHIIFIQQ